MRTCPYCEGEISETARKCRHCGEWVKSPVQKNKKIQDQKKSTNNTVNKPTQSHKFNFPDIDEKYILPIFYGSVAIFGIIMGYLLPKDYGVRGYISICLFWAFVVGIKSIKDDLLPSLFSIATMGGLYFIGMIIFSYSLARCLYNIGLMGPMTYSHIVCDKTTGFFKDCRIKGNVGFESGEKIYHKEGCVNYEKTTIDRNYGESNFPSEKVAEKAGFRKCKDNYIEREVYSPDYSDFYDDYMPRGGF